MTAKIIIAFILFLVIWAVCEILYRNKQKNRVKRLEDDQRYINNDRKIGW